MRALLLLPLLLASCSPTTTVCYVDEDGDGFGLFGAECSSTTVEVGGDCVDTNPLAFPDADEIADDGIDQDCNGVDAASCRADEDDDGWGGAGTYVDLDGNCRDQGDLPAVVVGDCDDSRADVHPLSPEIPGDGIDNDCNGGDAVTCFYDGDGDGYGAPVDFVSADDDCDDEFETSTSGDCDDSADWIHPGAGDQPGDGFDADCDGTDPALCHVDEDGDGFGTDETVVGPDGHCDDEGLSIYDGDCDDTSAAYNPFAYDPPEDGEDQNCDGVDSAQCWFDGDEDGFGWSGGGFTELDGDCLDDPFHADQDGDCNDADPTVNPDAVEVPNDGIDQDCDGAP